MVRPGGLSESILGGQTRNPHNLYYTPGGSNCGSGTAVAANYAPLSIGTDTSSSVLIPSAFSFRSGYTVPKSSTFSTLILTDS
ncbi:hypothetical protein CMK14_21235 [Candidatus Poribacteria bacterium]|nr:hypothetical protein [Candidatus Poribacteria bacterium]